MSSSRKIKITLDSTSKCILIAGNKLTKTSVFDNFGVTTGILSCVLQGEECFLQTDHTHFLLDDKVNEYKLTVEQGKF